MRNANKILVGRNWREKATWKYRRRWEDNIEMNLKEIAFEDMDWIYLALCMV